jgi:hypothetical protein
MMSSLINKKQDKDYYVFIYDIIFFALQILFFCFSSVKKITIRKKKRQTLYMYNTQKK